MIIPTFNERENVANLIVRIENACSQEKIEHEIVVVDDDSPDGTAEVVRKMNEQFGNLKVFSMIGHSGVGTAVCVGASLSRYDTLVTMDADFSHPPDLIPALVKGIRDADLVVCSRYASGGKMIAPYMRRNLSSFGNSLARLLLRSKVHDLTGGFHAMRKTAFRQVKLVSPYGDYSMELIAKMQRRRARIVEIPYCYRFRREGRSKTHLTRSLLWYLLTLLRLTFWT